MARSRNSAAVRSAIQAQKVVSMSYDKGSRRLVEVYAVGLSSRGNQIVRGFQLGGPSQRRNPVGWKTFLVSKISGMKQTKRQYEVRDEFNPEDQSMSEVSQAIEVEED